VLRPNWRWLLTLLVAFLPSLALADDKSDTKPAAEKSFRVPYQLTDTKHILVRARINGKGPFHFIIDTGAPTLFVSTESAKKHGLEAGKEGWSEFDKLEIEGGPVLEGVKARVETPFQVSGMNAMGLPGIRLDGMLGYTVLAHYRIELDLTKPHMVWTRIPWQPPAPQGISENGQAPAEIAVMGNMAKFLQMFIQKRPAPVFVQRRMLGVELSDSGTGVSILRVLPESPAALAGMKEGDKITHFQEKPVTSLADLHALAAEHAAKEELTIQVDRGGKEQILSVKTGRGL
jgi:hypothetical protein